MPVHNGFDPMKPAPSTTMDSAQDHTAHDAIDFLTKSSLQKSPLPNSLTTIRADKQSPHRRKDLPLPNFDRNLTVEKARFDPQPLTYPQPSPSLSSNTELAHEFAQQPQPNPSTPQLDRLNASPPHENMPSSQPYSIPSTNSNNCINPNAGYSTSASSVKSKHTGRSKNDTVRSIKKRRRPAPISGVATPSEVFHRNLVDAVSNVEDSDENERYVYPYTTDNHYTPDIHRTSSLYQSQPVRPLPGSPSYEGNKRNDGGFFSALFRVPLLHPKSSSPPDEREEDNVGFESVHRPKLRSYVMDHPHHKPKAHDYGSSLRSVSSKGELHNWYDGKISPPRRPVRRLYGGYSDGYLSDDESLALLRSRRMPSSKKSSCCLLLGVFLFLVAAYHTKPLTEIKLQMGRVLASDKELIFDLHVNAYNWNWWTVHVADADISVFAFSQVVPLNDLDSFTPVMRGVDPAEYLGSFYHFDESLSYPSSHLTKLPTDAISQIRIKSPGADASGNERW
ncbi:hypothetical protein EC973_005699 [Apophysomyces ossiformis]|uniref:Uncharacterized protein n=1 Tax=Apophysomyces ossiformis TaxID=679940 RepID=A0A8H7BW00_9FUNG|nr:hypothetical protein EC973_005699 [Apophysomyces ossiformis]